MKKVFAALSILVLFVAVASADVLRKETDKIPAHATDPAKCLGVKAAGTVYKVGTGGDVDISGWIDIVFYPTADGLVTYNNQATQTEPIYAGQANVMVINDSKKSPVTQIVPNVEHRVCGM
jgi:hypothetical protein